jgi:hypothetical protein
MGTLLSPATNSLTRLWISRAACPLKARAEKPNIEERSHLCGLSFFLPERFDTPFGCAII